MIAERLAINWDCLGGLNGLMSVPPIVLGLNGSGHELRDTLPVCHVMLALLVAGLAVMRSRFGWRWRPCGTMSDAPARSATIRRA